MNERSVVKVVEFGNREGERGTERVKCLLCRGGGGRRSPVFEMLENTKVERGATEQLAKHE
jgi:hypothetical protein